MVVCRLFFGGSVLALRRMFSSGPASIFRRRLSPAVLGGDRRPAVRAGLSGAAAAELMYVFQSVFNFFVVSGSGQAAITMPIMAPLADLLGVSRQTSVLAFQLGDAFTNLNVPTSGCLIGSLAIAKIEWSNWIKFMWKFLGILMIGAVITILIAVAIGF